MQLHGNIGLKARAEIYIYDRWHECGVHYSILVVFVRYPAYRRTLVRVCMYVCASVYPAVLKGDGLSRLESGSQAIT